MLWVWECVCVCVHTHTCTKVKLSHWEFWKPPQDTFVLHVTTLCPRRPTLLKVHLKDFALKSVRKSSLISNATFTLITKHFPLLAESLMVNYVNNKQLTGLCSYQGLWNEGRCCLSVFIQTMKIISAFPVRWEHRQLCCFPFIIKSYQSFSWGGK
jgi:hypothetical protein